MSQHTSNPAASPTASPTTSPVAVLIYDLLALLVFGLLARLAHDGGEPFSVLRWLDTSWPFMLGALAAWIGLRLGSRPAGADSRTGAIVWITSVIIGLGIWGIRNAAFPHWSFILVATLMSALLLFGWRGIARLVRR